MSQADIDLGRWAEQVLTNPAYASAWDRLRAKIIDELSRADDRDADLVMTLKRHLTTTNVVRRNLEMMIADGKEAKVQLDFEMTKLQKAKRAFKGR